MSFNFNFELGQFYFEIYGILLFFFLNFIYFGVCCPSSSPCCFHVPIICESA